MLGVLLIDKPQGITSHDVINVLRRRFQTKRIGHAGTLDPLGTGLLVVAVGPATRFLQYLPLEPKEYVCDFRFGIETNTQDSEGDVVAEQPVPDDLAAQIAANVPKLSGLIEQIPPMFSAVKKGGKPLYVYARQGEEVERAPRTVHIGAFELVQSKGNEATFRIVCSGGTYMRTLAHDLGRLIGCGAHLTALRRTRAGEFHLDNAVPLDDVTLDDLVSLREAIDPMPIVTMNAVQEAAIRQGQRVGMRPLPDGRFVALSDAQGDVFGVARIEIDQLQPECVIPAEAIHGAV